MKPSRKQARICNEIAEATVRDIFLLRLKDYLGGSQYKWASFKGSVHKDCDRQLRLTYSQETIDRYQLSALVAQRSDYWADFFLEESGILKWSQHE